LSANFAKLLEAISPLVEKTTGGAGFVPQKISCSSLETGPGSVFIAVKGEKTDGRRFIMDALKRGASAVIYEDSGVAAEDFLKINPMLALVKVSDSRKACAQLLEAFYGNPADKMKLIGITGTNGKTTCAFILEKILSDSGAPCGLISTVRYSYPGFSLSAGRTTPAPELFQKLLSGMVENKCPWAVMEVSSHALRQNRIGNAKFAGAIFTNLSGDHLDYHRDMEQYYLAKKLLFSEHIDKNGAAIINVDDPYGRRIISELNDAKFISYGFAEDADYRITEFKGAADGSNFVINRGTSSYKISSNLPGRHNASNITACFCVAKMLGINSRDIIKTIKHGIYIPGRLEKFTLKNGAAAYVDYAHTDDALEKVLKTLREICEGRLICVFGCGGDRDKTKRPRMGRVSANFADNTIITSDNPRSEDPNVIIDEILSGIEDKRSCAVVSDRREAIKTAIERSEKNDIILIAGKGHEKGQEIKGEIFPFDDGDEIRKNIS
jgi:UDP-N-acetylmuramoyl-L-alanyl-D-glutamate--2,6-diaminopimelate ligase